MADNETATNYRRIVKRIIISLAALAALAVPASASATGIATMKLYVSAHQAGDVPVPRPHRFQAIIGYTDQCVPTIPCWQYSKGTRSNVKTWPEKWYVHQDGHRIHDRTWPNLFVMNPGNAGWRKHVASVCARHCFLDGLGTSAVSRTKPRLQWTIKRWVTAVAGEVSYIRSSTGKRVLPNSVGYDSRTSAIIRAAGGRGSSEAFNVTSAKRVLGMGRMWVTEIGDCRDKARAFLKYKRRGDHFACYLPGKKPWNTSWR